MSGLIIFTGKFGRFKGENRQMKAISNDNFAEKRKKKCENCEYYVDGFCFFNVPSVQLVMAQTLSGASPQPIAFRPPVQKDHFCHNFTQNYAILS